MAYDKAPLTKEDLSTVFWESLNHLHQISEIHAWKN